MKGTVMKKAIANRVTVNGTNNNFRVTEANGEPCMNGRNVSDGGGFDDYAGAANLAREINDRRERKANG
jgi:hypothetical protein